MLDPVLAGYLTNTATLCAILVLAALGGLCSERSGIVNIGLEGKMLLAACMMAVGSAVSQSPMVGLVAALAVAVVAAWSHYILTQRYHLDHIISGMAINLFGMGATNYLNSRFKAQLSSGLPTVPIWFFVGLALVVTLAMAFALVRTRSGLRLLAVGNDPDKAREVGLQPLEVRWKALTLTGIFCGISGALVLTNTGTFSDNMTSGRGFIALAALIVGGWRPLPTLGACLLFSALEAGQVQMQGVKLGGLEIRPELWNATPYLITLLALGGLMGRVKAPSGLGKP